MSRVILAAADRDLLSAYTLWLRARGITAESVFDAVQLFMRAEAGEPGLCILDDMLPLRPPLEAAGILRSRGWRVILLRRDAAVPAGAVDAALRYPFTPEELLAQIAPYLSEPSRAGDGS